jgi:serine/threonine protein kinase
MTARRPILAQRLLNIGSFGAVVLSEEQGETHAVKTFFDPHDPEVRLLRAWARSAPAIFSDCALVGSQLVERGRDCEYCRFVIRDGIKFTRLLTAAAKKKSKWDAATAAVNISRVEAMLKKAKHYHNRMEPMHGDVGDLLSGVYCTDFTHRLALMLQIASSFVCMHKQGYVIPDFKMANLLYRRDDDGRVRCVIGDLGSVCKAPGGSAKYVTNLFPADRVLARAAAMKTFGPLWNDPHDARKKRKRTRATPHAFFKVKFAPATYVDIFRAVKVRTNWAALCGCNHLANQFSFVIMMLEMLNIKPPSYALALDEATWDASFLKYARLQRGTSIQRAFMTHHCKDETVKLLLLHPRKTLVSELFQLTVEVWQCTSNWSFFSINQPREALNLRVGQGTPKNYASNIRAELVRLWKNYAGADVRALYPDASER